MTESSAGSSNGDDARVAIVTGAASGIGSATVDHMLDNGYLVVACDVNRSRLHELATRVPDHSLVTVHGDVTDQHTVDEAVRAARLLGPIRALANCAGIHDGFSATHEIPDAVWQRLLEVDLTAPMRFCRAVLPDMMAHAGGSIVNVGSIAAMRGGVSGVAYTTAKHGLLGLTRSIASMYSADRIRCNIVCPGRTATNIAETDAALSLFGAERLAPSRSMPTSVALPTDVAGLIAWLLGDNAHNISGALITCDGGWSAT